MKGLLALISEKIPSVVKSMTQILENDKARAVVKTVSPHPDVIIKTMVAFTKKEHFKDLAEAMVAAREQGVPVKDIAEAIGCSVSTVYKTIRDTTKG